MIGILLSLLFLYIDRFFKGWPLGNSFLVEMDWLNSWYWMWGLINGGILLGLIVLMALGNTIVISRLQGSYIGKMVLGSIGVAGASFTSLFVILRFIIRSALLIGGSSILARTADMGAPFTSFDSENLFLGATMLFVGLYFFGAKRRRLISFTFKTHDSRRS